jgi:hypothetical protein
MTWFRIDDTMPFHEKIVAAGNAAVGLWARAGAWCGQQHTDGRVPHHIAAALGTRTEIRRLVEVGLWIEKDDGYQFHQFEERNPLRAQVMAAREDTKRRQAEWRKRRKEQRDEDGDDMPT